MPLRSATAVQGSSVTLTCTVISEREMDVTTVWFFNGRELAFSQQTSKNGSFWTIRSVQFSDEGFYSCKVTVPGFSTEVTSKPAKVTIFSELIMMHGLCNHIVSQIVICKMLIDIVTLFR